MFALSVKQPWASLIICGFKKVEFRNWEPEHDFRCGPLRIAIHATMERDDKAIDALTWDAVVALRDMGCRTRHDLPLGMVIGTVDVIDVMPKKGWMLDNPREWLVKEAAKGGLGLWQLEDGIEKARYKREPVFS